MQLTEHRPGNHHVIRRAEPNAVWVDDQRIATSLLVGARLLQTDWPVHALGDLDDETLQPLFKLSPEVVLLGVGERQQLPDPILQRRFLEQGIGLECMTLPAACRTFNVLMSENRRAVAALILPRGD
ncbi:MAG: hypothetical protein EA370_11385 [Wenzhouxiangella sp.]|nr:MAG: hypothetical protein EA370_11385 [Wenzhouxiangella sp.]